MKPTHALYITIPATKTTAARSSSTLVFSTVEARNAALSIRKQFPTATFELVAL